VEKTIIRTGLLLALLVPTNGCWLAVAGAGAEAGYVATQEERTVSETVTDQTIVARVKAKLAIDSSVPALDINVDSDRGVVTLRGVVESDEIARQAISLARTVGDVRRVESQLVVVPRRKPVRY
jgi:hyperosmotically inducible periplasmic protein